MAKTKAKPKRGRPLIKIDMEQVEQLAAIGATQAEIASHLGVTEQTLHNRKGFLGVYKRGMVRGRLSLRHKQFNLAKGGDKTMLVWLGKQLLGQSDRRELSADVTHRAADTTALIEMARNGGFGTHGDDRD